jgi:hypothetical protein
VDLEKIFSTTEEAIEVEPEKETLSVKIVEGANTNWLKDAIDTKIKRHKLAEYLKTYQEMVVDTMKSVGGRPGKDLCKRYGGAGVFRSVWQPGNIPAGSRARELPVLIRCAIQEGLAVEIYRKQLLKDLPTVLVLRMDLAHCITGRFPKKQITLLEDDNTSRTFEFWDGIVLPEKRSDVPLPLVEEALELSRMARESEEDKIAIQRVVDVIENSPVSRISDEKDYRKYVAYEVSVAVDKLVFVSHERQTFA